LTKIEGLDTLTELEELYLSHNGLTKIEGLRKLVRSHPLTHSPRSLTHFAAQTKLTTLDVGNNKIVEASAEELAPLTELEEFWVSRLCRRTLTRSS
jgi:protein phosphatase 1 regulatory subunit 7